MAKPENVQRKWYLVDATDLVLGRMAVIVADYLRGKHKAIFTPNQDCGDYVVVVNASDIVYSKKTYEKKVYYWHTGWPGGLKKRTLKVDNRLIILKIGNGTEES